MTMIVTMLYISYTLNAEPRALHPSVLCLVLILTMPCEVRGTASLESERPEFEFWLSECLHTPVICVLHEGLA